MMATRKVTSVKCQKIDKKGKALTFSVVVTWNDGTNETKCLPYVTLFDFRSKLSEKYKDPSINIPELPDAKKFERGFLRGASSEKRKAAVEEFFQKVIWLPDQCSETVKEFFEYRWGESAPSDESRTSHCDSAKVQANPTLSNPPSTPSTPAVALPDTCHYESVDEVRQYASICFNPLDPPAGVSRQDSVAEPIYWAVYKYDRRKSGEVTLKEGSAVSVMQKELSGWWFVHVQDTNEQGWAPASCLLPEDRQQLTNMTVTGPMGEFQAVCDHVGNGPDELSYKKKDRVEVLEARMDGWWKVRCNGKVGLTPATHLEPTPPKPGKNPAASRANTGSIYHHVTLYRKISPPPRRNDDDDVEELYAKVNKFHVTPPPPAAAVPQKPSTIDLQTIYEDGAAASQDPTDENADIASCLYSEIPTPVRLLPEDYKGTEVPLDNGAQEDYENVSIQKPSTKAPRYVNVQLDEQGKPITAAADSSASGGAGKSAPAAGGTIGRKPPPSVSAKPAPSAPAPIKKPPGKPAPMPPRGEADAKATASTPTANGDATVTSHPPPLTSRPPGKAAAAPAVVAAPAAVVDGGGDKPRGKPLPQVPPAGKTTSAAAPPPTPPKSPSIIPPPSPSTGKNAVLTPSIVAQNILKGRDKIRVLKVDRAECEKMLTIRGHERDFVLRESSKPGCPYALSVLFSDRIHHFPIVLTAEKKYYIGQYEFATVSEVLSYYRDNALCHTDDNNVVSLGNQLEINESHLIAGLL